MRPRGEASGHIKRHKTTEKSGDGIGGPRYPSGCPPRGRIWHSLANLGPPERQARLRASGLFADVRLTADPFWAGPQNRFEMMALVHAISFRK